MQSTGSQPVTAVQAVLSSLRESRDLSAYDAVERLVQGGEAVGLNADALVRMLDHGMTFAEVLELIESRMEAPAPPKRDSRHRNDWGVTV